MRAQQFFLLAAAVALAAGRVSNRGPQECGSCGKCCGAGWEYKKNALDEDVCESTTGGGSCHLCPSGTGVECNPMNVKDLGVEATIYREDLTSSNQVVGVPGASGDLRTGQKVFDGLGVSEAIFSLLPSHMENIISKLYPWNMPRGFGYKVNCDPAHSEGCDAYIMFYTCADCPTGKSLELAASLVANGWHRLSCAVSFRLLPDAQNYGFVTYTKELAKGASASEIFLFENEIRFVSSGYSRNKLKLCSSIDDTDACNDLDGCKWDTYKDSCVPGCPPRRPQPGPWGCPCPVDAYNSSKLVNESP